MMIISNKDRELARLYAWYQRCSMKLTLAKEKERKAKEDVFIWKQNLKDAEKELDEHRKLFEKK